MKIYKFLILFTSSLFTFSALAENAKQDSSLPPVVIPGVYGNPDKVGKAPSDAMVLFDGKNFNQWESTKGGEVKWKLIDGAMEVVRGTGMIQTKKKLGYGQYHVEWRTPDEVKGSGQGRGNSGFFPLGGPEVQVLGFVQKLYLFSWSGWIYL
jgi:hypothetical protein